jgi:hypothetical protein
MEAFIDFQFARGLADRLRGGLRSAGILRSKKL